MSLSLCGFARDFPIDHGGGLDDWLRQALCPVKLIIVNASPSRNLPDHIGGTFPVLAAFVLQTAWTE